MVLSAGSRLGAYEILAALGAGGMGEVYRAHDTKLNRDVAIKVLPEEFAQDPERISRFHREAQAVAALNHPNVAAIYEFAESDATRFLVLELVEGPTLAERLAGSAGSEDPALHRAGRGQDSGRGRPSGRPIPIEEALNIATRLKTRHPTSAFRIHRRSVLQGHG